MTTITKIADVDLSITGGKYQPLSTDKDEAEAMVAAAGFVRPSRATIARIGTAWDGLWHPAGYKADICADRPVTEEYRKWVTAPGGDPAVQPKAVSFGVEVWKSEHAAFVVAEMAQD